MRIAHLNGALTPGPVSDIVRRFPVLASFPAAQAQLGHDVHLVCRSDRESQHSDRGVTQSSVDGVSRASGLLRLLEVLKSLEPDVIHLNGIIPTNALLAVALRSALPRTVIAIQDQVVRWPLLSPASRVALRSGLASCDLAFFAARALADDLLSSGALRSDQVFELPGGSTEMAPIERGQARASTGLCGEPQYLWVGRLDPAKNPALAARAMAQVLKQRPTARLAMVYGDDQMLQETQAPLEHVHRQVAWLGRVPHEEMREIYGSSDVLVSSSWREGYSFALAEAMACGVSPVVSAIPSSLKTIGQVGRWYSPGDEDGLVVALLAAPTPGAEVRAHFDANLSYPAMGVASLAVYRRVFDSQQPRRKPGASDGR